MNPDNCVINLQTKAIRTDIDLSRFLYIEWNSEHTGGGAGLGHILYSVSNLINYYTFSEIQNRTIIFSTQWRPNWKLHSPNSIKTVTDIRDYYDLETNMGTKFGIPIKIYFDYQQIFRNTFTTTETIGFALRTIGKGFTEVRTNNKNIVEVLQLNEAEILKYNYNFWGGEWHTGGPSIPKNLDVAKISFNCWLSNYPINKDLKNNAKEIFNQCTKNNNEFYVMHLRRGDRIEVDKNMAESSEIDFIKKQLMINFPRNSSIYIMSNGTSSYISDLKKELELLSFVVFSKEDFPSLVKLGEEDNFALFTLEQELCRLCKRKITNRDYLKHNDKVFSLIYEYSNKPVETIVTKNEDILIKVGTEGERYQIPNDSVLTVVYGSDERFVVKDNYRGIVSFTNTFFGTDPNPGNRKFGYIKICNKKELTKVGQEHDSYYSANSYTAVYGANNKYFCKRRIKGSVVFNNETFGDPLSGCKKQAYIIPD